MAEVTSGRVTVIILNSAEASALADLLSVTWADNKTLDELTSTMIGMNYG